MAVRNGFFNTRFGEDDETRVPNEFMLREDCKRCIVMYSGEWEWAKIDGDNNKYDDAKRKLLTVANHGSKLVVFLDDVGSIQDIIETHDLQQANDFVCKKNKIIRDLMEGIFPNRNEVLPIAKQVHPMSAAGLNLAKELYQAPEWGYEMYFFEFVKSSVGSDGLVLVKDNLIRQIMMPVSGTMGIISVLEATIKEEGQLEPILDLNEKLQEKLMFTVQGLLGTGIGYD